MGNTSDKAIGLVREKTGVTKRCVGKLVGSERLQTEGKVLELEGKARKVIGQVNAVIGDRAETPADEAHNELR
jgi:uncharacterized protein YjbJ (UPF0337 family)